MCRAVRFDESLERGAGMTKLIQEALAISELSESGEQPDTPTQTSED